MSRAHAVLPPGLALVLAACSFESDPTSGGPLLPDPSAGTTTVDTEDDATSDPDDAGSEATADGTTGDGPDPTGDDGDTGAPPGPAPFGEPAAIDELNATAHEDEGPTLSADQLEIYFASDRDGSFDVWRSTRPSTLAAWNAPQVVAPLSTAMAAERSPELGGDGRTLMFVSDRAGSGLDVFVAFREPGGPWSAPVAVAALSSSGEERTATPVAGSDLVLLCSNRPGGAGGLDIWESMALRDGGYATPTLSSLSTIDADCAMSMRADQRQLVFASDRPGGVGGWDLWSVTRDAAGQPWSAATPVGELDSPASETDPWISADGATLVFASNRHGPNHDLFVAVRAP